MNEPPLTDYELSIRSLHEQLDNAKRLLTHAEVQLRNTKTNRPLADEIKGFLERSEE